MICQRRLFFFFLTTKRRFRVVDFGVNQTQVIPARNCLFQWLHTDCSVIPTKQPGNQTMGNRLRFCSLTKRIPSARAPTRRVYPRKSYDTVFIRTAFESLSSELFTTLHKTSAGIVRQANEPAVKMIFWEFGSQ